MTTDDKELLLHLVTWPGMYLIPVTVDSTINFIHGYEVGTHNSCDFTHQLGQLLATNYNVPSSSDSWAGQLRRLAKKRSSTWLFLFRRLTLETIVQEEGGRLTEPQQAIVRKRVTSLLERLSPTAPQPRLFWAESIEDWLTLCPIKSRWFQQLWTQQEWAVVKRTDQRVQAERLLIGVP